MRKSIVLLVLCLLGALAGRARQEAEKPWTTLTGCTVIRHAFNDGDSFHVRHQGREYIFRLYFVDAPETDESLKDRLQDQAAYWGLDKKSLPALGREAARFSMEALKQEFTVHTRWADARGNSQLPRFFALIETEAGGLSESLVEKGLARVYGAQTELPDRTAPRTYWKRLEALEKKARAAGRGAWGLGGKRPAPPEPRKKAPDRKRPGA